MWTSPSGPFLLWSPSTAAITVCWYPCYWADPPDHELHFCSHTLTLLLSSYAAIARAVLRMQSTAGLQRAFGTCGAHLTVVSLFFIPVVCIYLQPPSGKSQDQGKFIALFYTVVTPSLNPLIYTLRNKDVRGAVRRLVGREREMWQRDYNFCPAIFVQSLVHLGDCFPCFFDTSFGLQPRKHIRKFQP